MYPRAKVETSNRGLIATGRVTEAMATAQRRWLQGVLKLIRDDVRAFACVLERDCLSDSACGSGHECDFPGEGFWRGLQT